MNHSTDLNTQLWDVLGLKVQRGGNTHTLARDGVTWLKAFVRAADGFAEPPPDFANDLNATMAHVPPTVQVTRRWSGVDQEWRYIFMDGGSGQFLAEGRAATEAEACARALLQWRQLEGARAT